MKQCYTLTAILLFIIEFGFAQQMPIDFSGNSDGFTAFANSGFSFNVDPENATNEVGQFFNDGSEPWQGFYIDLTIPVDLAQEQQITLSFYQFDPNAHNIYLKFENGNGPDVEVVQNTSGSGWTNNLVFDFSNAIISGTNDSFNATGSYNRLVIFIDGGVNISGTYLVDDIDNGLEPYNPNELDVVYTDLVWADEFNANGAVDANNWFHQTQLPAGGSWFNGEQQHYTNRIQNSFVENGFLNIVAINESFTDQGETKNYTSARLNSKFAFTYGRIDVRAKLPFGDGTWPAIWMLGKNINEDGAYWDNQGFGTTSWPACGEIDVMEHGLGPTNHVSSAIHAPCEGCFGNTMHYQAYVLNDVANDFHVYSVNWSPNQITFLIDDVGFYTYNPAVKDNSTWPFYEDQYVLLNIAMGGIAGPIDANFNQSSMIIDYVRIFQNVLSNDDVFTDNFKIAPNPTSDVFKIITEKIIDSIELYTILGQLVLKEHGHVNLVNVQNLKPGMYILKLYSGEIIVSKRIIVD